jgi:hypothetical protein
MLLLSFIGAIESSTGNSCHLYSSAQDFRFAAFEIPSNSVSVCVVESLRDDEAGHVPAEGLILRPSKDVCRAIVPVNNAAIGFHHDDSIQSSFKDQPQPVS